MYVPFPQIVKYNDYGTLQMWNVNITTTMEVSISPSYILNKYKTESLVFHKMDQKKFPFHFLVPDSSEGSSYKS